MKHKIIKVGDEYKSKNFGDFKIIEYIHAQKIKVKFYDTKNESYHHANHIRSGKIRDKSKPTVFGIGYVGEGEYSTNHAHSIWHHMMRRCYCKNFLKDNKSYIGCSVCVEWHNYQVFAKWFYEVSNYEHGLDLDKDLITENNKIYSPDTCIFVPRWLNNLLLKSDKNNGLPSGVVKRKNGYVNYFNGIKSYDIFKTKEESYCNYIERKSLNLLDCLNRNDVPEILIEPLTERANAMLLKSKNILIKLRMK